MSKTKQVLTLLGLFAVASSAFANCADNFAGHVQPQLMEGPFSERTHLLCFKSYAALESGITKTGLWSAEQLTAEHVLSARGLPRNNDFHAEESIPSRDRAELVDYEHSQGYDRGHLMPSGDAPDADSQAQTFTLANMSPQAASDNRKIWEHIEYSTRVLAKRVGTIYVVTGPGFTSTEPRLLNGRVRVPDLIWKAVYVPGKGAAAYLVRNDSGQNYAVVPVAEITRLTGVDPFPALSIAAKQDAIDLPAPMPHKGENRDEKLSENTLLSRPADNEPMERTNFAHHARRAWSLY
jgi:endonuclease G, mitochondrial